jgi:hypothetical protein
VKKFITTSAQTGKLNENALYINTVDNAVYSEKNESFLSSHDGPTLSMKEGTQSSFSFIEPMKALPVSKLPEGEWLYEVKHDGYRALAFKDGKDVRLVSRNKKAFDYPQLLNALKLLPADRVILDGEIVALDEKGRSSFQLLQVYKSSQQRVPLAYYVFDLLFVDGKDLRKEPLSTIEVAQFIYLLLNNQKLRDLIDTIASKAVLILGWFFEDRKPVRDAIRDELRKPEHNYLPIVFDFQPLTNQTTLEKRSKPWPVWPGSLLRTLLTPG